MIYEKKDNKENILDNKENILEQNDNNQNALHSTIDNEKIRNTNFIKKESLFKIDEENIDNSTSKVQEKNNDILQNLLSKKKNNLTISNKNINTIENNYNKNIIKHKKDPIRRRSTINEIIYNKNKLTVLYELSEYHKKKIKKKSKI